MVTRLVLGCGSVGRAVVRAVRRWPGELYAVVAESTRAEGLREGTVRAVTGDPTDASNYPETAETVFVGGDDATTNLATARAARERFPDALLVVYDGGDADDGTLDALSSVADHVVDRGAVLSRAVLSAVTGPSSDRMTRLLGTLRDVEGTLGVVMHDNPDPDAIASALAIVRIAESVGVPAEACYFGDISHQENRALVNLLDIRLRELDSPADVADYGGIALVDHSRPGVNDGLDPDTAVDVVVDHHPPRGPVDGAFVDLRDDVGATSTLVTGYLDRLGIEPTRTVATALLYGIRVDTDDFTRETSETDYEAAAYLVAYADLDTLRRVESPSMSAEVLETLGRAIRNRVVREGALASGVGEIRDRDAIAQAADHLLNMEGIRVSLVYGFMNGTVYVSGRARGATVDLGETLRDALGAIGSAGGHADMAGAQVPLGILGDVEADSAERLGAIVDEVIQDRFFDSLRYAPPGTSSTSVEPPQPEE
jgi:nanoRNase/pAp phosphatase (c-di-AMP/oligoRNAs hydrolase)